jgi:hypothetical protein
MVRRTEGDRWKEQNLEGETRNRKQRERDNEEKEKRKMDIRNRIWNKEHRTSKERMKKRSEGDGYKGTGFGTMNTVQRERG